MASKYLIWVDGNGGTHVSRDDGRLGKYTAHSRKPGNEKVRRAQQALIDDGIEFELIAPNNFVGSIHG